MNPRLELYPVAPSRRIYGRHFQAWIRMTGGALLVLAGGGSVPLATFAQQPATTAESPGRERTAEPGSSARQHFDAAMAHYRARRYRDAIHEFELSIAKVPSADVWFNIGRAHEQLGEFRLAVESYRHYLRDRVNAPDAAELGAHIEDLTRNAEAAATSLQRKANLGALAIDADQPGALVLLDGGRLGLSPVDRILEVSPGPHRLEASRAGYVPFRARIEVQPGALSAAYVDLQPLTRYGQRPTSSLWTWIVLGASAAALGTSGAFGVLALMDQQQGERADSRRWARASDFALGGALVLAVGAAVAHFASAGGGNSLEHGPTSSSRPPADSAHPAIQGARRQEGSQKVAAWSASR
jgi:hypothetical protein